MLRTPALGNYSSVSHYQTQLSLLWVELGGMQVSQSRIDPVLNWHSMYVWTVQLGTFPTGTDLGTVRDIPYRHRPGYS